MIAPTRPSTPGLKSAPNKARSIASRWLRKGNVIDGPWVPIGTASATEAWQESPEGNALPASEFGRSRSYQVPGGGPSKGPASSKQGETSSALPRTSAASREAHAHAHAQATSKDSQHNHSDIGFERGTMSMENTTRRQAQVTWVFVVQYNDTVHTRAPTKGVQSAHRVQRAHTKSPLLSNSLETRTPPSAVMSIAAKGRQSRVSSKPREADDGAAHRPQLNPRVQCCHSRGFRTRCCAQVKGVRRHRENGLVSCGSGLLGFCPSVPFVAACPKAGRLLDVNSSRTTYGRRCAEATERPPTPVPRMSSTRSIYTVVLDLRSRGTGYAQPGRIDRCESEPQAFEAHRASATSHRTVFSLAPTRDPKRTGHGPLHSVLI
ncbi:hypothetical protein G7046_g8700 [Stylonectria norvegica]|nr:hypothetical protein G7046_g8700 [Stylonectria norvegica]